MGTGNMGQGGHEEGRKRAGGPRRRIPMILGRMGALLLIRLVQVLQADQDRGRRTSCRGRTRHHIDHSTAMCRARSVDLRAHTTIYNTRPTTRAARALPSRPIATPRQALPTLVLALTPPHVPTTIPAPLVPTKTAPHHPSAAAKPTPTAPAIAGTSCSGTP